MTDKSLIHHFKFVVTEAGFGDDGAVIAAFTNRHCAELFLAAALEDEPAGPPELWKVEEVSR